MVLGSEGTKGKGSPSVWIACAEATQGVGGPSYDVHDLMQGCTDVRGLNGSATEAGHSHRSDPRSQRRHVVVGNDLDGIPAGHFSVGDPRRLAARVPAIQPIAVTLTDRPRLPVQPPAIGPITEPRPSAEDP